MSHQETNAQQHREGISRRTLLATTAGCLLAATARPPAARASDFPSGPITLIVPWAPGGTTDFLARLLQPRLQATLGQSIVIDNRPGAAGNIGMRLAAQSKADGHTIFFGDVGTTSINPNLYKDLRVDPGKDFVPLSVIAQMPVVLVATPSFPVNTVAEFVAYAKERPGKISYVSQGAGTINHLVMEALAAKSGISLVHVPNKGGTGPASADVMGGHVPIMFASISGVISHIRSGRMKALTVTTGQRHEALPDVPTIVEAGYPDLVVSTWQALFVPTGTPPAVNEKLQKAIAAAMADAEVTDKIRQAGATPSPHVTLDASRAFIDSELTRWAAMAKMVGAKAE